MNYLQWQEEVDYSISARYDRFDGFDRGDVGRDQEYVPDAEEEAEMLRSACCASAAIIPSTAGPSSTPSTTATERKS